MKRKWILHFSLLLLMVVASVAVGAAQVPDADPSPQERARKARDEREKARQFESLAFRSFADGVFRDERNKIGFSLSASELYTNNFFRSNISRQPGTVSAFHSRFFVNFGRRRSKLHIDYGAGYRIYNTRRDLDGIEHAGNFTFSHQISRRTVFQISDNAYSSPNDFISDLNPTLSFGGPIPGSASEVYFSRQRVIRNSLDSRLGYQLTRNSQLDLVGTYEIYRYRSLQYGNSDGVQLGVQYSHRLAKWLSLTSSYSTYQHYSDDRFRNATIHRIEAGGLDWRLGRAWRVAASGGLDVTDTRGIRRTGASANARLSRNSLSNVLFFAYQRGFTTAVGISRVLQSDIVSIGFGQRLSRWINLQLASSYGRSSEFLEAGMLEVFGARAGLGFALRPDLIATWNYSYQNQRNRIATIADVLYLNRYVVSFGLQYIWPASHQ